MARFKGRALVYPILLVTGWIAGRVAYLDWQSVPQVAALSPRTPQQMPLRIAPEPSVSKQYVRSAMSTVGQKSPDAQQQHFSPMLYYSQPPRSRLAATDPPAPPSSLPWSGLLALPQSEAQKPESNSTAPAKDQDNPSRWFGYGYSFWRIGTRSRAAIAPAGQYGGSQSGFLIGRDFGGDRDRGLAVVVRAAATPSAGGEELALAMRWQKPLNLPLSLNGERRIAIDGPDRWAAYAAGGFDSKPLPADFRLDGYGQAGWASGKAGGAFFDAQLRATRQLTDSGGFKIRLGGGAWAGGQEGVHRIDLGPTVSVNAAIGQMPVDVRLDWRNRIGGNAAPQQGITITVATGF